MERVLSAVFAEPSSWIQNRCSTCGRVVGGPKDGVACTSRGCSAVLCSSVCLATHAASAPQHDPLTTDTSSPVPGSPRPSRTLTTNGLCRTHTGHCALAALKRFLRGFLSAYGGRVLISVLMATLRKKRITAMGLLHSDNLRFGMFVGLLCGSNSGFRCLLRAVFGKDSRWQAGLAGFLAGFSLLADKPSRHSTVALYLLCRSLYAGSHSLMRLGHVPRVPLASTHLFGLANTLIMFSALYVPKILAKEYYVWMTRVGGLVDSGLTRTFREPRALRLKGAPAPFMPCRTGFHPDRTCFQFSVTDFPAVFARTLRVYLPVHLVPLLLLRFKAVVDDPIEFLSKAGVNVCKSAAFLTGYITLMKTSLCTLRNIQKRDYDWHAVSAGYLTGLTLLFEAPKRRSELMLFCMPRAIEVAYALLERRGWVGRVKYGEVFIFASAVGLMLSIDRIDYKPTYSTLLGFLFGPEAQPATVVTPVYK